VLVHGAAGGVGQLLVQLAVDRGARVIGTASERNHDFLRELGGEPVAYGSGLADRVRAVAPDGVDAAIDLAGTDEALDVSLELVADRSRVVTIANFTGRPQQEGVKVLGGGPGADPGEELRMNARLELTRLAGEGRIRVAVEHAYPLTDVRAAHEALATRHARGKLVLVP
jgi:NADPH:quinone reductase-like Zn-dependent oxidoreductase